MSRSLVERIDIGEDPKAVVKDYFSQWYEVTETDKGFKLKNRSSTLRAWDVRLIIDDRVEESSRLYIEVWSVKELGRYGWAWTATEDMIVYFAVPDTLYMIKPEDLRRELPDWIPVFGAIEVRRKGGYHGVGIPVTEEVMSDACTSVRRLD